MCSTPTSTRGSGTARSPDRWRRTRRVVQGKAAKPVAAAGPWREAFGRLIKNKLAVVGLVLVIGLLFCGIFGPFLAPWPYQVQDLAAVQANGNRPLPPFSPNHFLGTDQLGRDLLSRLLDGARISITVAFVVQAVIICLGVPIGALAGWFGGRTDNALMRLTDVIYAFPDILFIILLSVAFRDTVLGQSLDGLLLVFVAIGLVGWVTVARLTRGQMLALKETEFVEAARAIGVSDRKIVTRHLLPNGMGPIIVAITLGIPVAILAEATLAYIGIGVQPPRASWGSLIAEGQKFIRGEPHLVVFPAIAIALALIGFTFLGDGLRDALDPEAQGQAVGGERGRKRVGGRSTDDRRTVLGGHPARPERGGRAGGSRAQGRPPARGPRPVDPLLHARRHRPGSRRRQLRRRLRRDPRARR